MGIVSTQAGVKSPSHSETGVFPHLSIVVVNWNLKEETRACLHSILEAGGAPSQIILVDNGSEDGSVEMMRAQFGPKLTILALAENLGFAGGNNAGIRVALREGAEWVLLLNNDTVIAKDMLVHLAQAAQNHPEYGILAPVIFYYDAPEVVWYLGHRLVPGTMITRPILKNKQLPGNFPSLIEVDFLVGCGVMIGRDVFEQIGLLDEAFFMYAEETDFFWRARTQTRMACISAARMWHKVSMSAKRDKPKTRYYQFRNQIFFYRRYARGLQIPLMWMFTGLRTLAFSLRELFHNQPALLFAMWRGFWDGWVGRPITSTVGNIKVELGSKDR